MLLLGSAFGLQALAHHPQHGVIRALVQDLELVLEVALEVPVGAFGLEAVEIDLLVAGLGAQVGERLALEGLGGEFDGLEDLAVGAGDLEGGGDGRRVEAHLGAAGLGVVVAAADYGSWSTSVR